MNQIFIEFTREGTGEPFIVALDEIRGANIRGIIVPGGGEVHTEEGYEEIIKKLQSLDPYSVFRLGELK